MGAETFSYGGYTLLTFGEDTRERVQRVFENATNALYEFGRSIRRLSVEITVLAEFDRPQERFEIRSFWKGTKEYVYFVRIDSDGIETVAGQIWHRVAKAFPKPKQGPVKRLRFLTANRCDFNRGRHFDRKAR